MKCKSNTIACLFLLSSIIAVAQKKDVAKTKNPLKNFTGILKITLESDSSTKSVLISNVMEEKSGDMSPVIGAATWTDSGKELQCNSLLEFDFNLIPIEIIKMPSLILRADLVLYPINVEFAANDNEKPSVIYIRQVNDKWEDSSTRWKNQPTANVEYQVSDTIETKNKNMPVTIDVTDIVLNNILNKKNNGFMILYDENTDQSFAAGQLFASPKNENPDIRPQLVIYAEYLSEKEYTKRASAPKPVNNSLNELYWRRNTRYVEATNPNSNLIYNMNLRPGSPLLPRTSN